MSCERTGVEERKRARARENERERERERDSENRHRCTRVSRAMLTCVLNANDVPDTSQAAAILKLVITKHAVKPFKTSKRFRSLVS